MIDADLSVVVLDPRPVGGLKAMLAEVAAHYDLKSEDLMSFSRAHAIAHPRQAFMWHARQVKWPDGRQCYSLKQIGLFLGGLDHGTVHHGISQHALRLKRAQEENYVGKSPDSSIAMRPEAPATYSHE